MPVAGAAYYSYVNIAKVKIKELVEFNLDFSLTRDDNFSRAHMFEFWIFGPLRTHTHLWAFPTHNPYLYFEEQYLQTNHVF